MGTDSVRLFNKALADQILAMEPAQGPQMLFFSLAHIAPIALSILFISGLAFICLMVFASLLQIVRFNSWFPSTQGYRRAMLIILCVQVIHIGLLITYDHWAVALFANHDI